MIDLETLGTRPDCVVVSIGAVFFDPIFGRFGDKFEARLSIEDQLICGRSVNADTLKWWMNQTPEARSVFNLPESPTDDVLATFHGWITSNEDSDVSVWGNGATFDVSILENLFLQFDYQPPWKFSNVMDLRTFRRFCANNENVKRLGVHHNALDDAISQAAFVIEHNRVAR